MNKLIITLLLVFLFCSINVENKYIHIVEKEHHFSSINNKDLFQIVLTGKNIIDGEVTIRILTTNDSLLFEESYPSIYLIGYGLVGEEATNELQEKYILKRMN